MKILTLTVLVFIGLLPSAGAYALQGFYLEEAMDRSTDAIVNYYQKQNIRIGREGVTKYSFKELTTQIGPSEFGPRQLPYVFLGAKVWDKENNLSDNCVIYHLQSTRNGPWAVKKVKCEAAN